MYPRPIPPEMIDNIRSPRTREVAELLNLGLTNRQAAAKLDISIHTLKSHLRRIHSMQDGGPRKLPLPPADTPGLTLRESEVVRYSATLLDSDLAEFLEISVDSVRVHLRNARQKANL